MDSLFESQFSPLAASGKPLSKCGKCMRYMKYIPLRPSRLFCPTCEDVYLLPQNGTIKLYKELTCPLDNFELVLFSLSGEDGKTFPLCPYCYNSPPFEGVETLSLGVVTGRPGTGRAAGRDPGATQTAPKNVRGGMPCTMCPHPTCRHSMVKQGVCGCPECDGTLVLDPVSAPKWRLDCSRCNCLVYLPENAHKVAVAEEKCDECGSALLEVNFHKNLTPLQDGNTLYKGCVICDEFLTSLLQAEEAATAEKLRLQAEADADAQARSKEAQDLLQRHEASSIDRLKFWHFEPNGDEATPKEQHKEFMAKLVTRLVYTCNHLQSELANLQRAVRNHKTQHEDATRALDARVLDLEQAVPGPDAGASSSASSSRQLEERVDHVVAMLGDISAFTEPATISQRFELLDTKISQQQQTDHSHNNSSARPYKMPTFRIEKFDDCTHQDPVVWWQGFTTELGIHEVPDHLFISALFINTKGGCQIWLSHMATIHGVQVSDLYKKVSWEDMTKEWKKRFIVDDAPTLAINRIFTMAQGSTPTRDWLTDWQKIVATPDLDLPFPHLRREFYNRSCAALSLALGDREQYNTFVEIINKARELIKTNRAAAHEKSTWQPTYVEKVRTGPRQQQFAAVQSDSGDNPAATPASSDGDQVAAIQPRSNNKSRNNGKAKSASQAGNGQPVQVPWVKFGLTEAEYKVRGRYGSCYWCNNTKHKTSLCQDQGKEDARPRLNSGN
ncbi:hypothetical protein CBR_g21873 [Chara braunii]|uniref:DNA topoisomerase n=1 Tax=Chara braunii TaxID=69332 RepID=A0A388L1C3_CHABU|nr:hypothetical protein CBR_g21873 [Chara braunii]|eukprot:GBG76124.1 hypothetical protein CBR_g21873 [Chara braunii]